MTISSFDYNMNIISALEDEPNDVGGLTASQLKAKFDEGGNALKTYVNETLLPGISQEIADAVQNLILGQVPGMTILIPLGEDVPAEQRKQGAIYWNVLSAVNE